MRGADCSCQCRNSVLSRMLLLCHCTQAPRQHVVCRTRTSHLRAVCMQCHHRMACVARAARPSRSFIVTPTSASISHQCVVRACAMRACMSLCRCVLFFVGADRARVRVCVVPRLHPVGRVRACLVWFFYGVRSVGPQAQHVPRAYRGAARSLGWGTRRASAAMSGIS